MARGIWEVILRVLGSQHSYGAGSHPASAAPEVVRLLGSSPSAQGTAGGEAGAGKEEGLRSTVFMQKGEGSGHAGLGCLTEVSREPRGDVGLGFCRPVSLGCILDLGTQVRSSPAKDPF